MANRAINFLGYQIDVGSVDDIEQAALGKVQERAHRLYVNEPNYNVAQAWIESVLEYLYHEGQRQEAEEFKAIQENYKAVCEKSVKNSNGGIGDTNE